MFAGVLVGVRVEQAVKRNRESDWDLRDAYSSSATQVIKTPLAIVFRFRTTRSEQHTQHDDEDTRVGDDDLGRNIQFLTGYHDIYRVCVQSLHPVALVA